MEKVESPSPDTLRSRNQSRLPIPEPDDRLIMYEMRRRAIPMIGPLDWKETSNADVYFSDLPAHLREEFNALSPEEQNQMNAALKNRNGLIVEFNQLISAHLGCNTNVTQLGSEEQSKSCLCYLLKYVTKSNTGIIHSASLILSARQHIETFPSVADDTGTEKRTAMHLLNRITNKISSAVEISSHMAALALLGAPGEFISCPFQKVFVREAATYASRHPNFVDSVEKELEFEDLPGDEWDEEGKFFHSNDVSCFFKLLKTFE